MKIPSNPVSALKREAEIARALAHHGWDYLLSKLPNFATHGTEAPPGLPLPDVLRQLLIELGPTFVKLGQLLSTRSDMLPPAYIEALATLQSDVPSVPWEVMQPEIESALGCPVSEVFGHFNTQAIAAGSLGQVYEATLLSGEKVAVKVQRPRIRAVIEADLRVMRRLAHQLGNSQFAKSYDLDGLIDEFRDTLFGELDFAREARNTREIGAGLASARYWPTGKLRTPEVYEPLSSERLLVLEWVDGTTLTKANLPEERRMQIANWIVQMNLQQFFIDGFFHADPHPGNLFYIEEGDDFQIVLLDCGMVGRLDPRTQSILIDLFVGVIDENPRRMARSLIDLGFSYQPTSIRFIQDGCDRVVRRLHTTTSLQEVKIADLLGEVLAIPRENHIQLPSSVGALAKTTANVEGVARYLNPNLPTIDVARPVVAEAVEKRFIGKDALQSASHASLYNLQSWSAIPERLEILMDQLERSELGFQLHWPDRQEFQRIFSKDVKQLSLALISVGCVLSGAQLIAAHSEAASDILGVHLVWGNLLLISGLSIAAWLVLMLFRNR